MWYPCKSSNGASFSFDFLPLPICTTYLVGASFLLRTELFWKLGGIWDSPRGFCYIRNYSTPDHNKLLIQSCAICCCTWLLGHFRKHLCGFRNYLCEVSLICSPSSALSSGNVIVGSGCYTCVLLPQHVYYCCCFSNPSSVFGFVSICSFSFRFLVFMLTDLLLLDCWFESSSL
jgi:hypothetical protein